MIIALMISHFLVGAFSYLYGSKVMKDSIEKELMRVLDEFQTKNQ